MKIGSRLAAGFTAIALMVIIAGYFAVGAVGQADRLSNQIAGDSVPTSESLGQLRSAGLRMVASASEYGFLKSIGAANASSSADQAASAGEEASSLNQGIELYNESLANYTTALNAYGGPTPTERALLANITRTGASLVASSKNLFGLVNQSAPADQILAAKSDNENAELAYLASVDAAHAYNIAELASLKSSLSSKVGQTFEIILALSAFVAVASVATGLSLRRSIVGPLKSLHRSASRIGGGDLETPVDVRSSDEIGELSRQFDKMRVDLKAHIEQEAAVEKSTMHAVGRSIAHDIRNPLTAIRSAAFVVRKHETRPEERLMLDLIDRNVVRAEMMARNLIDFSSEETVDRAVVDVKLEVEKVLADLVVPSNVHVKTEIDDGCVALVDKAKMERVYYNIMTNALEAMPKGGELSITGRLLDGSVELTIRDTGVGIPPERLKSMFTPFYTTKPKGMGLGLMNAKKFVELHGGSIGLRSEPGRGTTVLIELPASPRSTAPAPARRSG